MSYDSNTTSVGQSLVTQASYKRHLLTQQLAATASMYSLTQSLGYMEAPKNLKPPAVWNFISRIKFIFEVDCEVLVLITFL